MKNIQDLLIDHLNNTIHGSGFDCDWKQYHLNQSKDLTRSGYLLIFGGYHNMNEYGYYDSWTDILIKIPVLDPKNFKLVLKGKRKYTEQNKEYFEQVIYNSLLEFFGE